MYPRQSRLKPQNHLLWDRLPIAILLTDIYYRYRRDISEPSSSVYNLRGIRPISSDTFIVKASLH